jgi:hypothetical protein
VGTRPWARRRSPTEAPLPVLRLGNHAPADVAIAPAQSYLAPARSAPADRRQTPNRRCRAQDVRRHTGARKGAAPAPPAAVLATSFSCSVGSLAAATGEDPVPPLPPPPVSVKPEKASPSAPPGLGAAPGHPWPGQLDRTW